MECAWQPETLFMSAGSMPASMSGPEYAGSEWRGRAGCSHSSAILTSAPGSPEGWRSLSMTSSTPGCPGAEGGWSNRKEVQAREISADKY